MSEKKKGRLALFVENMLAYGATTALAKVVPLIMLPIITKLLTDTADYGRYDMYNTIVEFGTNIAVLGMYDAMFREFFERDDISYKMKVTSTAFSIVCVSSLVVSFILCLFNVTFSNLFFGDKRSGIIVILSGLTVLIMGIKTVVAAPIRMENRRKLYVAISLLGTIAYYGLALAFVLAGYNYAGMIYANMVYALGLLVIQYLFTHKHFSFLKYDQKIAKELLKIGLPLLPTFLAYWVFHGMDKIMITNMIGLQELGIYSVGSKLAQVSQIVYTAFSVGWQYFAFSTMKDEDQVKLNTRVMEYLGLISFFLFIASTFVDDFVFQICFAGDYVRGVTVFPFLFLSPLLLMIYQVIGNQTIVYKKSYLNTLSLVLGTILNLCLNYLLIPLMGIKGAAIATLSGYLVSFMCMVFINLKYHWMEWPKRFGIVLILTMIYTSLLIVDNKSMCNILGFICIVVFLTLYSKELKELMARIKR